MTTKVLIGLSGGVDSAVAALLLKQQGFAVTGAIMSIWDDSLPLPAAEGGGACLGPEEDDIKSAAAAAEALGIPFQVVDCRAQYAKVVLENFRSEYASGRTPNPCVRCNSYIKFGVLPAGARAAGIGFDYFATGHYARVEKAPEGYFRLRLAKDIKKDQTYFIHRLNSQQLAGVLFPLGEHLKTEVRALAKKHALPVHDKPDSQDFYCGNYNDILRFPNRPGAIVDTEGRPLGRHDGIWNYTIGKRRGLGISGTKEPLYVVALDGKTNRVTLGPKSALYSKALLAQDVLWQCGRTPAGPVSALVKIRQAHPPAQARITPLNANTARVEFEKPQLSVTPGQSAVFYQDGAVIGGGIIEEPQA